MKITKISIIILNWNGWKDTIECLESLYGITYPNYEVIVVDNNSHDSSIEMIKKWADGKIRIESKYLDFNSKNKPIKYLEITEDELSSGKYLNKKMTLDKLPSNRKLFILKNNKNYGFAEGNNIAMKMVYREKNSDYIVLLNNDTVVEKDFLLKLLIKSGDNIVVSPLIKCYDSDNIWFSGGKVRFFPFRPKHTQSNRQSKTEYLCGCCFLFPTKLYGEGFKFNKDYFVYFEDFELFYRFRNKIKPIVNRNSVIYHKESKASGLHSPLRGYFFNRNRLWFIKNNLSGFYLVFNILFYTIGFSIMRLYLLPKYPKFYRSILRGIYDGLTKNHGESVLS